MPQYKFLCRKCKKEFISIEPFHTEKIQHECQGIADRVFTSEGGSFAKGEGTWMDGRFGNDNHNRLNK